MHTPARTRHLSHLPRAFLLFLLLIPAWAPASVYFVRPSAGNDGNAGTTWSTAFRTLAAAAGTVASTDTILVASGETSTETVTFSVSASIWPVDAADTLTLRPSQRRFTLANPGLSTNDTLITVDGNQAHVKFWNVIVDGHLAGSGNAPARYGIFANGDSVKATGCIFRGCTSAGISASGSPGVQPAGVIKLVNCLVEQNTGDGVSAISSTASLVDCVIRDNGGQGLYCQTFNSLPGQLSATRCDIFGNAIAGVRAIIRKGYIRLSHCSSHDNANAAYSLEASDITAEITLFACFGRAPSHTALYIRPTNTTSVEADHLTLYGSVRGIENDGSGTLALSHSIVASCDTMAVKYGSGGIVIDHSVIWQNNVPGSGATVLDDVREVDPRFAGAAWGDFRPLALTPARIPGDSGRVAGAFPALGSPTDPWRTPAWSRDPGAPPVPRVPPGY